MTSDRLGRLFVLALPLASLAAGCGDYSNEDLEYMNALPQSGDLDATIPAVTSAVELAHEAELAKQTHDTIRSFNGFLATLIGIVDAVRSYPPTARTANGRVWGPFPMDQAKGKNLDWETMMTVERDAVTPGKFRYEISVHHDGSPDTDWFTFLDGWFQTGEGRTARRGVGFVELVTADVRAHGLDVSDLGMLDHLDFTYDTFDDPVTNTMHLTNLAVPGSADPAPTATFTYSGYAAGQGDMTFDLIGNLITVTPAVEDMRVTSHWLPTGEGRADLEVVAGDGMGSKRVQCWDSAFAQTFNDEPWDMTQDFPAGETGDPTPFCPVIPNP